MIDNVNYALPVDVLKTAPYTPPPIYGSGGSSYPTPPLFKAPVVGGQGDMSKYTVGFQSPLPSVDATLRTAFPHLFPVYQSPDERNSALQGQAYGGIVPPVTGAMPAATQAAAPGSTPLPPTNPDAIKSAEMITLMKPLANQRARAIDAANAANAAKSPGGITPEEQYLLNIDKIANNIMEKSPGLQSYLNSNPHANDESLWGGWRRQQWEAQKPQREMTMRQYLQQQVMGINQAQASARQQMEMAKLGIAGKLYEQNPITSMGLAPEGISSVMPQQSPSVLDKVYPGQSTPSISPRSTKVYDNGKGQALYIDTNGQKHVGPS